MLSESAIIIICGMSVGLVGSCLFNIRRARCVKCAFCCGMCVCEQQPLTTELIQADTTLDPSLEVLKYMPMYKTKQLDLENIELELENSGDEAGIGDMLFDTRFSKEDLLHLRNISSRMGLISKESEDNHKLKNKIKHKNNLYNEEDNDDYFEILTSYSLPHSRTCSPKYSFDRSVQSFR